MEFFGAEVAEVYARSGGTGDPSTRLWHELAYADGDLAVQKTAHKRVRPRAQSAPRLPGGP